MHRAIIIDDEEIGINSLKVLLEKHTSGIKVIAITTDAGEGISMVDNYKPDVVFLDISMPEMNGFELLERVTFKDFKLVFTTAHEEYAIKAIKSRAYDYLLKPIDIEELKNCVNVVTQSLDKPGPGENVKTLGIIELPVRDGVVFIRPNDIIRLEASGSYTFIYLDNKVKHVASKNLKEFELMLEPSHFYRCHLSHIVNLQKVEKMVSTDGLFAQMSDGSLPEIGRKNKQAFIEKLKKI